MNDANRRVLQIDNSKFDGEDKAVDEVGEVVAEVVDEEGVVVVAGNEIQNSGVDESE